MAFVINPDGTITTVEADYDRYGNLRPKIPRSSSEDFHKSLTGVANTGSSRKQRKKKKKAISAIHVVNNTPVSQTNKPVEKPAESTFKKVRVITRQSVERFFERKKSLRQLVTNEEFLRATVTLKGLLLELFLKKYEQYKEYCREMGWGKKILTIKKSKKKKKKNLPIIAPANAANNNHKTSANTIGNIAKFSTIKDSMADDDVIYNRTGFGASHHPKYGYARDKFGRVQERDSFNEDKRSEFKLAQSRHKNYDYSNYDAEDDHDSYYDSGGYE